MATDASAAANAPMCSTDDGRVENVKTTATVTGNVTVIGVQTPITTPSQTTTQLDCYSAVGELMQVVQSPDTCGAGSPNPAHTQQYTYNDAGLDATQTVPDSTGSDPSQAISDTYKYDALGRRYAKTENLSGQSSSTSNYAYLDLSTTAVTSDQTVTAQNTTTTNSYDYNSHERPVGIDVAQNTGGTQNYYSYAKDPNGTI